MTFRLRLIAGLLLTVAILFVYRPVGDFAFVNYDDEGYLTKNLVVREGLTARGLAWAFTSREMSNWHPITWLSHMLDVSLFGLDPGAHHLVSVALHAINGLLLFGLLGRMTGAFLPSAAVAFLFALHPLHVESVAWLSERKDLLSTCFALLAVRFWVAHLRRPAFPRYAAALLSFALALLAKPMPVTLPFVLLLLDYWPLARLPRGDLRDRVRASARLVWEKAPFFCLSAASAAVTLSVQTGSGAVGLMEGHHSGVRAATALVAYVVYLGKAFWPAGLAVYYPFPSPPPSPAQSLGAAIFLLLVSAAALLASRRRPYLPTGWFWYLGTLVPVIGLVKAGSAAWADRYTYLPLTGIFLVVAWGLVDLSRSRPRLRVLPPLALGLALTALAVAARLQVGHWRDSETLFRHALAVTGENWQAHNNLALALEEQGRTAEAAGHFREALQISPGRDGVRLHLSRVLFRQGAVGEGRELLVGVVERNPRDAGAAHLLGNLLLEAGLPGEAVPWYRRALDINPDAAEAASGLGTALVLSGSPGQALEPLRQALRLKPDLAHAHAGLGLALAALGDREGAIRSYREALRHDPASPTTHNNLGIALVTEGLPGEAEVHFREALRLRPSFGEPLFNLGVVLASRGRIAEAEELRRQFVALHPADARSAAELAGAIRAAGEGEDR